MADSIEERFFDDGTFPPWLEAKKARDAALNPNEERPAPFAGKTQPFARLSVIAYGLRLKNWLDAVQKQDDAPTTEQFAISTRVSDRVLQ